jgi:trk system potassium uptake protein TrkA
MRILIVGAGRLGRLIAAELLHARHDVHVLDASDYDLARLPHEFAGRVTHGPPLDRDVLAGAADGCDAIACVTDDDNLNVVVALAARRELHVPLAVAVVGNPRRAEALTGLGAHVICPTTRTAHQIHMTIVRSGVETELALGADAGVYRVDVPPRLAGRAIAEVERPGELIAVGVERGGRFLLAEALLTLERGDALHVAATHRDLASDLEIP